MYDKELVTDILKNIIWSADQIARRFQGIRTSDIIRSLAEAAGVRVSI